MNMYQLRTRGMLLIAFSILFPLAAVLSQEKKDASSQAQSPLGADEFINRNASIVETGARDVAGLMEKARAGIAVRVIVGVRAPFQPEGNLRTAAAVQAQRRAIAAAQTALLDRLAAFNVAAVKQFAFIPFVAMEVDAAALQALQALPEVTTIAEDALQHISLAESVPLVGAPAAWAGGFAGAGQAVAILDTGVDKSHAFLANKVVSEACYSSNTSITSSVCPGGVAQSTAAGSGVHCGVAGCEHGTHVAGIAAGKSATFSGVARDANVIAIQVFSRITGCTSSVDCTGALSSDILLGLQRVYDLRASYNIAAVNLSLGGGASGINCDATQPAYKAAIDLLRSAGIATVAASGNDGSNGGISNPACVSSAISVGSTGDGSGNTTADAVSRFSNGASFLNVLAPGESINSSIPGGNFAAFRGTSMAAPHVAGAIAVLKSKTPNASVEQAVQALATTGKPVADSRNGVTRPRIRVDAAVSALPAALCNYSISPGAQSIATAGGTATINVTAGAGCAWTAASNNPWITINTGASGTGNGSVSITAAANAGPERGGTLFIGGNTFIVNQASAPAVAVDDGAFEDAIGLRSGGTFSAVNRLTPARYPAAIDQVAIFFQSLLGVPAGSSITLLYGVNPTGGTDIGNVRFEETPVTVQTLDQFSVYSIPPLVVTSGDFVIGYRITHTSGLLPAVKDNTAPSRRRSYLATTGAYSIIDDLSSTLAGNFAIRGLLAPRLLIGGDTAIAAESCAAANGAMDPGETVTVNFTLRNAGTEALNNLVATLQSTGGVTPTGSPQTYGALAAGSSALKPFTFTANGNCGAPVTATLKLQDGTSDLGAVNFKFVLGALTAFSVNNVHSYSGAPVNIPDANTIEVPITVADPGAISDLNVRLRADHGWDADLDISLIGPDGTVVELSTDNGGSNDNYGNGSNTCSGNFTVFDDAAPGSIVNANAPFAGIFRPEGRLSDFNGKPAAGVWKLRITDDSSGDSGSLGCWQLELSRKQGVCCGSACPVISGVTPESAVVGSMVTIDGANLAGASSVSFGAVPANFTVVNATRITARVPAGARPGPITIWKPGCPDFQIGFEALTLELASGGQTALVSEECAPANQTIDPGERVTVNFPLKNLGTGNTGNLIATLQSGSGVFSPSGPQTYGAVNGGGTAIIRPFTFTASGACGGTITATLQLQDGPVNLSTISFNFKLGERPILAESFDRVTAPALPAGWTASRAQGTSPLWATSTDASDTAPNHAFVPSFSAVSDIRLDSPAIQINSATAQLTFRNRYDFEAGTSTGSTIAFDGGVLEIATGADAFTDILAAGGSFAANGYNRTVDTSYDNPLAGRSAWSGSSNGYLTTIVNLPASAAGKSVKFRWRMGTDRSDSATGWRIDGLTINDILVCNANCVACPTVAGINPSSGLIGATINLTGMNFTGITSVKFTPNVIANFTITSDTGLAVIVPAGAATGPLTIGKPGCPDLQTGAFTVLNPRPAIASLAPVQALRGSGALTLTINGAGFIPSSAVQWNGTARPATVVSATQLTAAIPSGDLVNAGVANVTVINPAPGGGSSNVATFTVNNPAPVVTQINLASTVAGGAAFTLSVSGSNFVNGSTVRWNTGDRTTAFISSTQLNASITATDIASAGTASVSVFTPAPGGGTSAALSFTINNPPPVSTTLSPNSATAGGAAFTLSVSGSNFVNGSTVRLNNSDRATTFVSGTQLNASITAVDIASAGTASVTVFTPTPGGGISSPLILTINPAPAITSLTPNPVVAGGPGFVLTVNGANLTNGSAVRWNGANRTTAYVNSSRLTAQIAAADIAAAGTARITIFIPDPGGGESKEAMLVIANPVANVSAASFVGAMLAPDSIISAFGAKLATATRVATDTPLPTTLEGTTVKVKDRTGVERLAQLFFVSPAQINYLMPAEAASGEASITVTGGDGAISFSTVMISPVAGGLFTANADGKGASAGVALRVKADGSQTYEPIVMFDSSQNRFVSKPIDLGPETDLVFLIPYGTGMRLRSALSATGCSIGGVNSEVVYVGPVSGLAGLDQVNIRLSRNLIGRGEVDVVLTVDGKAVNTVRVAIR